MIPAVEIFRAVERTFGDERTPRSRSFTDCSDPVVVGVQYWDSATISRMMGMRGVEQLEIADPFGHSRNPSKR